MRCGTKQRSWGPVLVVAISGLVSSSLRAQGEAAPAEEADAAATDAAATDTAATDDDSSDSSADAPAERAEETADDTASTPGGDEATPDEESSGTGDQEAPSAAIEEVPDSLKIPKTRESIDRMKEILAAVLVHLENAREERDVVKLNCVNEKLTSVKALLKISEQADVSLQEALARRNAESARREYEKVAIALNKCEQLLAESEACVGQLAVYAGDLQVDVEIEDEPPTDISEETGGVDLISRPPAASPYQ